MKSLLLPFVMGSLLCSPAMATTIMVVPVFEPLSLHDTDGDEAISDTGEALQACVMSRPMAMTGAYPEVMVDAIRSPHKIPTNNENYHVLETNLLILANIGIVAELQNGVIQVKMDVSQMKIPAAVDLTARQILNLTILAVRKTLEAYQAGQDKPLHVAITVEGTTPNTASLTELKTEFVIGDVKDAN